jgi:hypothetical protein
MTFQHTVVMHAGLEDTSSITTSPSTGRLQYAGTPLAITHSVCNSGHGGMVVMSGATFSLVSVRLWMVGQDAFMARQCFHT